MDEKRVLVTVNPLGSEVYLLPGGEPLAGELIQAAVTRHAREQTGYDVVPRELLWIREHTAPNRLLLDASGLHVAEFFYRCSTSAAVAASRGGAPHQVSIEWVTRERLSGLKFMPRSLVEPLAIYLTDRGVTQPVYAVEGS